MKKDYEMRKLDDLIKKECMRFNAENLIEEKTKLIEQHKQANIKRIREKSKI